MSGSLFRFFLARLWRVYPPLNHLPRYSSNDLSRHDLESPVIDKWLKAGDVLYLPRGTPHEARASEEKHSVHVTLSTYQRNAVGDLAIRALHSMLDAAPGSQLFEKAAPLRTGLPWGAHYGLHRNPLKGAFQTAQDASSLAIEQAKASLVEEFVRERLPPPPDAVEEQGECPALGRHVRAAVTWNKCWAISWDKDRSGFRVISCLHNRRKRHLMGSLSTPVSERGERTHEGVEEKQEQKGGNEDEEGRGEGDDDECEEHEGEDDEEDEEEEEDPQEPWFDTQAAERAVKDVLGRVSDERAVLVEEMGLEGSEQDGMTNEVRLDIARVLWAAGLLRVLAPKRRKYAR